MNWITAIRGRDLIKARAGVSGEVLKYIPNVVFIQSEIVDIREERGELSPVIKTGTLRIAILFPYNHNHVLWTKAASELNELVPTIEYLQKHTDGIRSSNRKSMTAKIRIHKALRRKVLGRQKRYADLRKEVAVNSTIDVTNEKINFKIQTTEKPLEIDTRKWARAVGATGRIDDKVKKVIAHKFNDLNQVQIPITLLAGDDGMGKPILDNLKWSQMTCFLERKTIQQKGDSRPSDNYLNHEIALVAESIERKDLGILQSDSSIIHKSVRFFAANQQALDISFFDLNDTAKVIQWKYPSGTRDDPIP